MSKREVLRFTREEISKRVCELGKQISKDYCGKDIVAIGLLRGSFVFLADLVREIDKPIVVDFMTTSSYEHSEVSSGNVNILSDIRENIEGKDVILVDDIKSIISLVKEKSTGMIFTMVCFDMTAVLKKLIMEDNND